jgi:hypothetical protein
MKHAGPKTLDRLEPLLRQIRDLGGLKEKSRGCFYLKSKGFLHFHEHGDDEIWADIGLGDAFDRLPAMTTSQHKKILALTARAVRDGKPARAR